MEMCIRDRGVDEQGFPVIASNRIDIIGNGRMALQRDNIGVVHIKICLLYTSGIVLDAFFEIFLVHLTLHIFPISAYFRSHTNGDNI